LKNNQAFWIDHFSKPEDEVNKTFINLKKNTIDEVLKANDLSFLQGKPFESAENRVFGFGDRIIKFYRPGRWSIEAIREEVEFLKDLAEANLATSRVLGDVKTYKGIHYLEFAMVKAPFNESPEILNEENVKDMAHLMAKIHEVGAKRITKHRPEFDPGGMAYGCFEVIKQAGYLPKDLEKSYESILKNLINRLEEFKGIPVQRIHADSSVGNIVWSSGKPIFLDFDDFQLAPKAMDLRLLSSSWRLDSLPENMDNIERRSIQQELVLKYYREVSDFPQSWEKIFSLLSAYRDIQFDAWFSSHWDEPGFAKNYEDDDISKSIWWKEDIEYLEKLLG
jgi:Ser/Thr protein kinase RdoA (MazF antagonist)